MFVIFNRIAAKKLVLFIDLFFNYKKEEKEQKKTKQET